MSDLFITGITGLVGRALSAELAARDRGASVLVRRPEAELPGHLRPVSGSLEDVPEWAEGLTGVETVIHAAAATGAASSEAFERVNVHGTLALLAACIAADVPRFIFVSSITAAFDDVHEYPYGTSKREAEAHVRDSGLEFAIVRPTVVLGPGSPIFDRFRQLAALPISVLPGSGEARIQPIDSRDLARCLLDLADEPELSGETIEVGGPQVVTLEEFLRQVRVARGKRGGPVVKLPLRPVRWGLQAAAGLTGGRFPVAPAQLAMFGQDGVAQPHPFVDARRDDFHDVAAAVRWSLSD